MSDGLSDEWCLPDRRELMAVIPAHCFEINERVAFTRLGCLLLLTLGFGVAAHLAVPKEWAFAPFWITYAAVNGTIANGLWVLAHECGHHAFSRRKRLETAVGFILHSALLVPYFTWRKSHAWHHARTNHLSEGETHVPPTIHSSSGRAWARIQRVMGRAFGPFLLASYLLVGWIVYATIGGLSTAAKGWTSHLWPFKTRLSPGKWKAICSIGGLAFTIGLLAWWASASQDGWVAPALIYGGPYLFVNAWVVVYTWLRSEEHTSELQSPA